MYGKMTSSWAADGPPRLMEMGRMSANLAVGQVILQKRQRGLLSGDGPRRGPWLPGRNAVVAAAGAAEDIGSGSALA